METRLLRFPRVVPCHALASRSPGGRVRENARSCRFCPLEAEWGRSGAGCGDWREGGVVLEVRQPAPLKGRGRARCGGVGLAERSPRK